MKQRNNNDVKFENKHQSPARTCLNKFHYDKSLNEEYRMKMKHYFKKDHIRCRKIEIREKFFFADVLAWLNRPRLVTYENVVFNIFR